MVATTVMLGGTLFTLACVAFLCFLWLNNEGNAVWSNIVKAGWVTRSIIVRSLLLRWAITAQAAVATSMVAAPLLQVAGTPLADAATVSLATFSNPGPDALLLRLLRVLSR